MMSGFLRDVLVIILSLLHDLTHFFAAFFLDNTHEILQGRIVSEVMSVEAEHLCDRAIKKKSNGFEKSLGCAHTTVGLFLRSSLLVHTNPSLGAFRKRSSNRRFENVGLSFLRERKTFCKQSFSRKIMASW